MADTAEPRTSARSDTVSELMTAHTHCQAIARTEHAGYAEYAGETCYVLTIRLRRKETVRRLLRGATELLQFKARATAAGA